MSDEHLGAVESELQIYGWQETPLSRGSLSPSEELELLRRKQAGTLMDLAINRMETNQMPHESERLRGEAAIREQRYGGEHADEELYRRQMHAKSCAIGDHLPLQIYSPQSPHTCVYCRCLYVPR